MDQTDLDRPRAIAAVFTSEAEGMRALGQLHDAGFKNAWLGVTERVNDGTSLPNIVHEHGGGPLESFVRLFSGDGGESIHAALIDHGVAEDVARRLQRETAAGSTIVIAGWTGDMAHAADVLVQAGGDVMRGNDGGVIGTPRPRLPGNNELPQ
ncbi:MAG: hypothetical protein NVS2B17_14920 [Candidatus Velthaea sp.]